MSPRHHLHVSIALALLGTSPVWAQPSPPCGDATRVSRSDTLSSIAARCDTTEGAILRANPAVEGSDDLRVGRELKLTASTTQPTTERLGSLAREAGSALSGMAQDLTSSVDSLLDKNPDLRQRLGGIGDRINSSNVDVSKAEILARARERHSRHDGDSIRQGASRRYCGGHRRRRPSDCLRGSPASQDERGWNPPGHRANS